MTWKLVPVKMTERMLDAAWQEWIASPNGWAVSMRDCHSAMLAASPDPATDEALVERVARVIARMLNVEEHWDLFRPEALAAIRAMKEQP